MSEIVNVEELKGKFDEGLKSLAEASKAEGEEALKTWSESQKADRVGEFLAEIAELKFKAVSAEEGSEDRTFYEDRLEKKQLQLNHAVEIEKILVSNTVKEGFFNVLSTGLKIVKEIGKEAVAAAVSGALKGAVSSLGELH